MKSYIYTYILLNVSLGSINLNAELNGHTFYSEKPIYTADLPDYLKAHVFHIQSGKDQNCNIANKDITKSLGEDVGNDDEYHTLNPKIAAKHKEKAEQAKKAWLEKTKFKYVGQAAIEQYKKTKGSCEYCDFSEVDLKAAFEDLLQKQKNAENAYYNYQGHLTGERSGLYGTIKQGSHLEQLWKEYQSFDNLTEGSLKGSRLSYVPGYVMTKLDNCLVENADISRTWRARGGMNNIIMLNVKAKEVLFAEEDISTYDSLNGYQAELLRKSQELIYLKETIENNKQDLLQARSCLKKGSLEGSLFENNKYYTYRYSKENQEKIKNGRVGSYVGDIPRNEVRPWDDVVRKLNELILRKEISIKNDENRIPEINQIIKELEQKLTEFEKENQ